MCEGGWDQPSVQSSFSEQGGWARRVLTQRRGWISWAVADHRAAWTACVLRPRN